MHYAALQQTLSALRDVDFRNAAEHAYVLAVLYKRAGNKKQAILFGREAIALFDKCRMETLDECTTRNQMIGRVALPDLIHQGVVRFHLQPLEL